MTDPAGGAPAPQDSGAPLEPPPPPAPSSGEPQAPPPGGGGFQAPPPSSGGFQTAPIAAGPAPGVAYADLVTRIIALVIDGIILGVGYTVVLLVLGILGGWPAFVVGGLLYFAASAVYFIYTWTTQRATYGQKFLSLETVNAADGATLTQDQAIRRWAYLWGPAALAQIASFGGVGLLGALGAFLGFVALAYELYLLYTASQSPKRQGFHDVQAGTVVVKRMV